MSFSATALALTAAVAAPVTLALMLKPTGADRGARIAAAIVGAKGLLLAAVVALLD